MSDRDQVGIDMATPESPGFNYLNNDYLDN
jgi:hypothetical protein